MGEQSLDQLAVKPERKAWVQRFPMLLAEIAISAIITDPAVARAAYNEIHAADSLPHN